MAENQRQMRSLFGVALLAVLTACSNQGEGEICSTYAADDCTAGLICVANPPGIPPTMTLANGNGICCPPAGQSATATFCNSSTTIIEAGIPATDGAAATDASNDAEIDAPLLDASSDTTTTIPVTIGGDAGDAGG